jgi:hypothetical protein
MTVRPCRSFGARRPSAVTMSTEPVFGPAEAKHQRLLASHNALPSSHRRLIASLAASVYCLQRSSQ